MNSNQVSLEKISKKAQKAFYAQKRNTWGGLNPVTRCNANSKSYNRTKEKELQRKLDN